MNLYPTRATFHVAMAGAAMIVVAVATHRAAPAAFGGGVLLVLAVGRGLSLIAATRLRRDGFEMVWTRTVRVIEVARGQEAVLHVELRNHGKDPVRVVDLRAVASSMLDVTLTPHELDLPPSSRVRVELRVRADRVGRWGLHGLALQLRGLPAGGEGLYEIPLVFSNPSGVEVHPEALVAMLRSPRGGRSGRVTELGPAARRHGEGEELRELREHVAGDAFKRIAWRASARRGRLMVREMERQERDVVWLVVDASVDGWAGLPGRAPLDQAIDEVSAVAARHLARGDRVGLAIFASRPRSWLPADQGPPQAARIAAALAGCSSMIDSDRCELDEYEVALRVYEHLRSLVPDGRLPPRGSDLDRLTEMAESARSRAPFAARLPHSPSVRESTLRHYLACFGIEVPPRAEGERPRAESELARVLTKLFTEKPRPTVVALWAPAPITHGLVALVARALRPLKVRRTEIRWTLPALEESVASGDTSRDDPGSLAASIDEAVRIRARAAKVRADAVLRGFGVLRSDRVIRRATFSRAVSEDVNGHPEGES